MSSTESEDVHVGEDVAHRLHATRTPFITAVIIEALFCILMTRWMWEKGGRTTLLEELRRGILFDSQVLSGGKALVYVCWTTLVVSVLGRLSCLCVSHTSILARKSGRCLALLYMFFGTTNWLVYFTCYYVGSDAASHITREHTVNVKVREEDHRIRSGRAYSAELNACLMHNEWDYAACGVDAVSVCTLPWGEEKSFRPGQCVAHIPLKGKPCCISEKVKLADPEMTLFGARVEVPNVFMLVKWLSVLLIGWVLRFGYFAAGVGERSFSQTAYLDILDIVIFSTNLNEAALRNPVYGFDLAGTPSKISHFRWNLCFVTFALAYVTVVLSQVIYTAFAPTKEAKEEDEASDVEVLESASRLGQPVEVCLDEAEMGGSAMPLFACADGVHSLRPGHAIRMGNGMYRVQFSDGYEPTDPRTKTCHLCLLGAEARSPRSVWSV